MVRRNDAVDWPGGLNEKIRALDRGRRLISDIRDHLDQLRRWGNAAAHPEASLIDEGHQKELAGRALASAIPLLETVFQELIRVRRCQLTKPWMRVKTSCGKLATGR